MSKQRGIFLHQSRSFLTCFLSLPFTNPKELCFLGPTVIHHGFISFDRGAWCLNLFFNVWIILCQPSSARHVFVLYWSNWQRQFFLFFLSIYLKKKLYINILKFLYGCHWMIILLKNNSDKTFYNYYKHENLYKSYSILSKIYKFLLKKGARIFDSMKNWI